MKKLYSFILLCVLSHGHNLQAQNEDQQAIRPRINHIAIYVMDLEKSRNFYETVMMLERIEEPFKDGLHEWFSIGGGAELHLIKGAAKITEHNKNSHICFSVKSIDIFIQNLRKHNITFTNWKGDSDNTPTVRVDGVKQIYFKDPDGYWLEVNDDQKKEK